MSLYLLSYVSESTIPLSSAEKDLSAIVETARLMNSKHNITGVLFFHQGHFLQVLEGSKGVLDQLMQNIGADQRHCNVTTLIEQEIRTRSYQNWNMGYFNLNYEANFDTYSLKQVAEEFKTNLVPHGRS